MYLYTNLNIKPPVNLFVISIVFNIILHVHCNDGIHDSVTEIHTIQIITYTDAKKHIYGYVYIYIHNL